MNDQPFSIHDLMRDFDNNDILDHITEAFYRADQAARDQAALNCIDRHDEYFPLYLWDEIP